MDSSYETQETAKDNKCDQKSYLYEIDFIPKNDYLVEINSYFNLILDLYSEKNGMLPLELKQKLKEERTKAEEYFEPNKDDEYFKQYFADENVRNCLKQQEFHAKLLNYLIDYGIGESTFFYAHYVQSKIQLSTQVIDDLNQAIIDYIDSEIKELDELDFRKVNDIKNAYSQIANALKRMLKEEIEQGNEHFTAASSKMMLF